MAKEFERQEFVVEGDHCPDAMFLCREIAHWGQGGETGEVLLTVSGLAFRYKDDQYHITFENLAMAVAKHIDSA